MSDDELELLTERIIGAAIRVHDELGPGLLESAYETCLALELNYRGIPFERQRPVPIRYRGKTLPSGYRVDFVIGGRVLVEIKSITKILTIHLAQVVRYLRHARLDLGLLINLDELHLRDGVRRLRPSWKPPVI